MEMMIGNINLQNFRKQKNVIIPDGVEKIGNRWFWGSDVESVTIPASVKELGTDAFCKCRNLKRMTFVHDSGLERIGSGCFCGTGIESITIPRSVTVMEERAFGDCRALREVVFQDESRLERIGHACFLRSGVRQLLVPRTVTTIESDAFCDCEDLKQVVFLEDSALESIGARCFSGSGLTGVTLPKTVREIGNDAFSCPLFAWVSVEKGCQADVKGAVGKDVEVRTVQVVTIKIPDGTRTITKSLFRGKNVYRVIVPKSVEEIQEDAFCKWKDLREVVFEEGSRLKTIGDSAFYWCSNLLCIPLPDGV